jgi:hypothetical protein
MAGGQPPKKRTSARRTGMRRSHIVLKLAKRVNATSPVQVITSKKQLAKSAKRAMAKAAASK